MAEVSKIQWTHATWNPWRGCTKVDAACKNCYAETMSGRNPAVLGIWGPNGTRVIGSESNWRNPLKWERDAAKAGERRRVFCASLADIFEGPETMPEDAVEPIAAARRRVFGVIGETPHLDYLLLTKRPENIRRFWPDALPRRNVWLGTTAGDQAGFDKRHVLLTGCRDLAPVLFLSVEPMLGPMDIRPALERPNGVDWVIVGGESGGGARDFNPEWARQILDQCRDAGVAFFFKQLGERVVGLQMAGGTLPPHRPPHKGGMLADIPADLHVREFPSVA